MVFNSKNGYNNFLNYAANTLPIYNTLPSREYLTLTNDTKVYRNRANPDYTGIAIITPDSPKLAEARLVRNSQTSSDGTTNPVDNFLTNSGDTLISGWVKTAWAFVVDLIDNSDDPVKLNEFSKTNIPIFPDINPEEDKKSRVWKVEDVDSKTGEVRSKSNMLLNKNGDFKTFETSNDNWIKRLIKRKKPNR